jgi:hypothetical protein
LPTIELPFIKTYCHGTFSTSKLANKYANEYPQQGLAGTLLAPHGVAYRLSLPSDRSSEIIANAAFSRARDQPAKA